MKYLALSSVTNQFTFSDSLEKLPNLPQYKKVRIEIAQRALDKGIEVYATGCKNLNAFTQVTDTKNLRQWCSDNAAWIQKGTYWLFYIPMDSEVGGYNRLTKDDWQVWAMGYEWTKWVEKPIATGFISKEIAEDYIREKRGSSTLSLVIRKVRVKE